MGVPYETIDPAESFGKFNCVCGLNRFAFCTVFIYERCLIQRGSRFRNNIAAAYLSRYPLLCWADVIRWWCVAPRMVLEKMVSYPSTDEFLHCCRRWAAGRSGRRRSHAQELIVERCNKSLITLLDFTIGLGIIRSHHYMDDSKTGSSLKGKRLSVFGQMVRSKSVTWPNCQHMQAFQFFESTADTIVAPECFL